MTLEQLKYFHAAATLSHIGKAAEQEHISQPSLSIAIKKLEQELNVPC
ncbi:MAG: LysR family transcriptional regulator [Brotaphodocola sp.]